MTAEQPPVSGPEVPGFAPVDEQAPGQQQLPPAAHQGEVGRNDDTPRAREIDADELHRIGGMFDRFVDRERRGSDTPTQGH